MEEAKELIVRHVYQCEYIGLMQSDYRMNECSLVEYLSEDQLAKKRGLENLYLNQYNSMKQMLETQSKVKEQIKQQLWQERSKNEHLNNLLEQERYRSSLLQEEAQELRRNQSLHFDVSEMQSKAMDHLHQQLLHERSKNEHLDVLLEQERQQNSFLQEKTQELYGGLASAQQHCLESVEHIEVLKEKEAKLNEELLRKKQLNNCQKTQIQQLQIKLERQVHLNEVLEKENQTLTSQLVDTNGEIAKIEQEHQNETKTIKEHLSSLAAEIALYHKEKLEFKKCLGNIEEKEAKLNGELLRKEQLNNCQKIQIQQSQIKLEQQVHLNERIKEQLRSLAAEIDLYHKEKLEFKKFSGDIEVVKNSLDEIKQAAEKKNAKLEEFAVYLENQRQQHRRESRPPRKGLVSRIWDELFSRKEKERKGMERKRKTDMADPELGHGYRSHEYDGQNKKDTDKVCVTNNMEIHI